MKRLLRPLLITLAFTFVNPAFALSLGEAKQQGLVGEQYNGLLAAVGSANSDVNALIKDINAKRMAAYTRIAAKNGTNVETVKKLAGKKAIEKTPRGQYVKVGGSWKKVP